MSNATATARTTAARQPVSRRATGPRLRVVTGADAPRSTTGFTVLCSTLLALGLLALLLLNTARAEQSFALSNLQQGQTTLVDNQEQLRNDLSGVSAPQQLALKAQEMGMVPAGQVAYVRASDGKVLGVANRAATGTPITVGTLPDTPASGVAGRAVAASDGAVRVYTKPAPKPKPKPAATASGRAKPSASGSAASPAQKTKDSSSAKPSASPTPRSSASSAPRS